MNGIYLAYPIDQARLDQYDTPFDMQTVEEFKQIVVYDFGASYCFDPGDAFLVNPEAPHRGVMRTNRAALNHADVVVAFLPKGVPSIGVPIEIDRAVAMGKTVIVLSDVDSFALDYTGHEAHRFHDFGRETLWEAAQIAATAQPIRGEVKDSLPVKLGPEGVMPTRAYEDDAGLDLIVSQDVTLAPGSFTDVPCDLSVELPYWSWGLVTGRSSALRAKGLLVNTGVIDAGYRGPLFAGAFNLTMQPVEVKRGERIAQLIVIANATRRLVPVEVSALNKSLRGIKGFGSTGK